MKKQGISLIILVITIIVTIILVGVVISNLTNNDPTGQASKAAFINDVQSFKDELAIYKQDTYVSNAKVNNVKTLQADETSVTYKGVVDTSKTIKDVIPSLGISTKYDGEFVVVNGELVYKGTDEDEKTWSTSSGVKLIDEVNTDSTAPTVAFGTNGGMYETGSTTVTVSDAGGSNLNTGSLQYTWDTQNITVPTSGWATFTNGGSVSKGNVNGTYYLWVKASDNANNNAVAKSNSFYINSIESYETPGNTVFTYTNVDRWITRLDVAYDGDKSFGTDYLGDRETATMEVHVNNIPNDGNTYYLTMYYKHVGTVPQYYDTFNTFVNGLLRDNITEFTSGPWVYHQIQLYSGNNTIKFEYTVDTQYEGQNNRFYIDCLQVQNDL